MSENIDEIIKGIRTRVEGTLGQGPVSIPLAYMTALCDEVERLRREVSELSHSTIDARLRDMKAGEVQRLGSENAELTFELSTARANVAKLRTALENVKRFGDERHHEDSTDLEVCYEWCPLCNILSALEDTKGE